MMDAATRFRLGVGDAYTDVKALTKAVEYSYIEIAKLCNNRACNTSDAKFQPTDETICSYSLKHRITYYFNELTKWSCCALVIGAVAERMGSFAMINYFLSAVSPLALGST